MRLFQQTRASWLRHTTALDKPKSNLQPKNYATKIPGVQKPSKNQTIIAFSLYTLSIWASAYPHNIAMPSKYQSNRFRQHQCPPPRHPSQGEVVVNGPDRVVKSNCLQCQIASPLHQQRQCPLHYGHVNFLLNASVFLSWLKHISCDHFKLHQPIALKVAHGQNNEKMQENARKTQVLLHYQLDLPPITLDFRLTPLSSFQ